MNLDIHFGERDVIMCRRIVLEILLIYCSASALFIVPSVNAQNLPFVVFAEGKHGYIDQKRSVVIPINLYQTYVNNFNEGLAKFSVVIDPQQKTPYLDQRGKIRIWPEEKWGFINEDGKIAIPPQFDKVMDFSEGLAALAYESI
jgi:hypothetical protein